MDRLNLLLILLAPLAAALAQTDPFLVEQGRVGPIHLGMTVDEFYAAERGRDVRLIDLQAEGMFNPALTVWSGGHAIVTAEVDKRNREWIIWRIELTDTRFHTAHSIRIGSTVAELGKAYPDLEFGMGEGQWFAISKSAGLSFGLDAEVDLHKKPSDRSRVTSILMIPLPARI